MTHRARQRQQEEDGAMFAILLRWTLTSGDVALTHTTRTQSAPGARALLCGRWSH